MIKENFQIKNIKNSVSKPIVKTENIENVKINVFIKFSFFVFIISIPFEALFLSSPLFSSFSRNVIGSMSRITGVIFVIASLTNLKYIKKLRLSQTIYWFIFIFVYIASYLINYYYNFSISLISILSIPWLILLFFFNIGILNNTRIRHQSILLLMVSIGVCSILQLLGYAFSRTTSMVFSSTSLIRVSAFGNDPNLSGAQYAVGLIISIFTIIGLIKSNKQIRILSVIIGFSCLLAMVQTGSRGAVLSFGIALLALVFVKGSLKQKATTTFFVFVVLIGLIELILLNEGFRIRFTETIEYGDLASRQYIYEESFYIFFEQPLIGFGPFNNIIILGSKFGKPVLDTHNTLLWVLTSSGLLGFIPFFLGLVSIGVNSFKSILNLSNIVYFSLFLLTIIFSQTVSFHQSKLFWLILAFASSAVVPHKKKEKSGLHNRSINN